MYWKCVVKKKMTEMKQKKEHFVFKLNKMGQVESNLTKAEL